MKQVMFVALVVGLVAVLPRGASAHCDALDGPVVRAARAALDSGNVTPVLRWVEPAHEGEVKAAFDRTLQVRKLGRDARELADTWFFETLVRVHRAGEGAPFDGLKPAGHIEPVIALVDQTLEKGTLDPLLPVVTNHVSHGITERFEALRAAQARADESVEAGRRYVAAYVDYMHYVEGLHLAASAKGGAHEK